MMTHKVKPLVLGGGAGFLLALLWILSQLLSHATNNSVALQVPDFSYQKVLSQSGSAEVLSLYEKYKKELPAVSEKNVVKPKQNFSLSAAQEKAQKGRLKQLRSGEFSYQLTGIFTEQQPFAVLRQTNLRTKATTTQKVQVGTKVDGYQVTQIRHRTLLLKRGNQEVELVMFKAIQKETR